MHSAIPSGWDVAPGHDGLHLVIGFLVDDGGVKAIHNRPALAGIVDGDMLGIPFASLTDVGLLIPHDFPGEGGVAEDVGHAVAGKLRGAVGLGAQGIDVTSDGDAAVTLEIQVVHHADKLGLRLVDLQGWFAIHRHLAVAIGGISHVAAVLNRLLQTSAEALVDDLVFPARHEGLELGHFVVQIIGEVVSVLRGNNQCIRVPEGIEYDALVLHAATGKPVQIHHQHCVVTSLFHVFQQAEHLGTGIQALATDHLVVGFDNVDVIGFCILRQSFPVLGQHLLGVQTLLHAALAEVLCCVHFFNPHLQRER